MTSLNRQRTNLLYSHFRAKGAVLTPAQAVKMERIFAAGSYLYGIGRVPLGSCEIGVRADRLFRVSSVNGLITPWTQRTIETFAGEKYILCFSTRARHASTYQEYSICLAKGSTAFDHLKAWIHAMELAHLVKEAGPLQVQSDRSLDLLESSLRKVNDIFPALWQELTKAGWDVENTALLTRPTYRISRAPWTEQIEEKKKK